MKFFVKKNYERTAAIRRSNRERVHKVNDRLMHYNIDFTVKGGIYEVAVIPKNIERLITKLGKEVV